ncbi:MAG: hypothetical protein IPL32_17995 [Chloracidobacterium sp.]|nr:hypothetical protein [Chloracidobacterium sp.]
MTPENNEEKNRVKNDSGDHHYFTQTPRIVWAYSRTPYDLALWQTIKDIAGDNGECFISTPDLAVLAMMSVGQCSESRNYLLKCGLLVGEIRKDPGYPLAVWHLSIPDLWEKSTAWSGKHKSIATRLKYKSEQREKIVKAREAARTEKAKRGLSPAEMSDLSPAERPLSPTERPPSPGEIKNIKQEDPKEDGAQAAPPAAWGVAWQLAAGVEEVVLPSEEEMQDARVSNAVEMFPQEHKELVRAFILETGIFPVNDDVSGWCKAFRDQKIRTGLSAENVTMACRKLFAEGLTIVNPFSIVGTAGSMRQAEPRKPNQPPPPIQVPENDWRKQIRL